MRGNEKKVIEFPDTGKMWVRYSKKLERALRDFITSQGKTYSTEELPEGIVTSYFRLKNDICVMQRVHIRMNDYVCYTTLSCSPPPERKDEITRCLKVANEINRQIDYGNFEVNEETGEVYFKSYYEPDENVYMEALDKLLGYPMHVISEHGHLFLKNELKKGN